MCHLATLTLKLIICIQGDDACSIEVDNVKKVERQVVAGTNYRVTVHLKSSCVIPGGAGEAVIKCRKLKVFVPLPVNCNNPNPDNPKGRY